MEEERKERVCHICGTITDTFCPICTENFASRRPAKEMTIEEKIEEIEMWMGPLEIDFGLVHQRLEELFGRPVWTHEIADIWNMIKQLREKGSADYVPLEKFVPPEKIIYVTGKPNKDIT